MKSRTLALVRFSCASHPARGAWVEMDKKIKILKSRYVAPRKGCVG